MLLLDVILLSLCLFIIYVTCNSVLDKGHGSLEAVYIIFLTGLLNLFRMSLTLYMRMTARSQEYDYSTKCINTIYKERVIIEERKVS